MIKIEHKKYINKAKNLSKEAIETVDGILTILDTEYGEGRNIDNDGGYVLLIENEDDFRIIKKDLYIDLKEDAIPEFVDLIKCENGQIYTSSLILCNNDFSISIIMLLSITPENLKNYIIEN